MFRYIHFIKYVYLFLSLTNKLNASKIVLRISIKLNEFGKNILFFLSY